jgi:hypothetical protein
MNDSFKNLYKGESIAIGLYPSVREIWVQALIRGQNLA